MTFADWQRSKGILPWTQVQAMGGPSAPGIRFARAGARLTYRLPQSTAAMAALGAAAFGAALRVAHFAEQLEHQQWLVAGR